VRVPAASEGGCSPRDRGNLVRSLEEVTLHSLIEDTQAEATSSVCSKLSEILLAALLVTCGIVEK